MSGETAGIRKRSVAIAGHRTSISLEDAFWDELARLAGEQDRSVTSLIAEVDAGRSGRNLSSALRVHVLAALKARLADASRVRT